MSWENFEYDEFACNCGCEGNEMSAFAIDDLQELRSECDFPFIITSGWRCLDHPREANRIAKGRAPGPHTTGLAVDIAVRGQSGTMVLVGAIGHSFVKEEPVWTGFGVKQHGSRRFIHLDQCEDEPELGRTRPILWSYK